MKNAIDPALLDPETGLMKIPLACDRCGKSTEELYRIYLDRIDYRKKAWKVCKACSDEWIKFKQENRY